jgi:uncharacterized damage-inducible protein DinB
VVTIVPIVDALVPEFDHEMTTTRKLLERVPEGKFDWKPHPRSMSLGVLATHVATIPHWGEVTLTQSEIDLGGGGVAEAARSRGELLAAFDKNVAATRAALVGKSDAELMAPWSLKSSGRTMFTMPKAAVWRSFVMNHVIHHRAQLSVYLRLNDVPVPSMYGPSADEAP